nr:RNA-directed DNA polymerase, eukaryota [Tanacetum cinerariifolium]
MMFSLRSMVGCMKIQDGVGCVVSHLDLQNPRCDKVGLGDFIDCWEDGFLGFEVVVMYCQSPMVDVQREVMVVDVRTTLENHPCLKHEGCLVVDINWRFDADSCGFLLKCVELVLHELVMVMLKFLEKDYGITKERIDVYFQSTGEEMITVFRTLLSVCIKSRSESRSKKEINYGGYEMKLLVKKRKLGGRIEDEEVVGNRMMKDNKRCTFKALLEGVFGVAWWSIWGFKNRTIYNEMPPRRSVLFDDICVLILEVNLDQKKRSIMVEMKMKLLVKKRKLGGRIEDEEVIAVFRTLLSVCINSRSESRSKKEINYGGYENEVAGEKEKIGWENQGWRSSWKKNDER